MQCVMYSITGSWEVLRFISDSCRYLPVFYHLIEECNDFYSMSKEEKEEYLPRWQPPGNATPTPSVPPEKTAWEYQSGTELKTFPYWGYKATYDAGGQLVSLAWLLSVCFFSPCYFYRTFVCFLHGSHYSPCCFFLFFFFFFSCITPFFLSFLFRTDTKVQIHQMRSRSFRPSKISKAVFLCVIAAVCTLCNYTTLPWFCVQLDSYA